MSLIVEDGTGKSDAESYISVADATAYHAARGNAAWAAVSDDTTREQLLRKATAYMVQTYRMQWAGNRVNYHQALDWPRYAVPLPDGPGGMRARTDYVPFNVVPNEVRNACAEFALRAISGDLLPDLAQGRKSVKVGPLQIDYDTNSDRHKHYSAIDRMLEPMFAAGNYGLKMIRS